MLNLNDVYYFVQTIDHGGFAPAARKTGVPKSTLAKRVTALEAELGVRLIQRSSRRFTVTDLGKEFYRHGAAMLIEAEAAENVVKGRLAAPSGVVRISSSVPTAQHMLAEPLLALARTYPRLRISLDATDRFVDVLQEGFDLAVRDHFAPLPDSELVQRTLCKDPIYLVAASAYLDAHGAPQSPSELAQHQGILTCLGATAWRLVNDAGEEAAVTPLARMAANESSMLLNAARGGFGITCLPRRLCEAALRDGDLVRVLPGWTAGVVTTTLLMPHRRGQLPSVRAVADLLAEMIS